MEDRSFNEDFREIVDEEDCVTDDMSSARSLADRQPGRCKVYSYRPSRDVPTELSEDEVDVFNASGAAEEQEVTESDCIMMCRLAAAYLL